LSQIANEKTSYPTGYTGCIERFLGYSFYLDLHPDIPQRQDVMMIKCFLRLEFLYRLWYKCLCSCFRREVYSAGYRELHLKDVLYILMYL